MLRNEFISSLCYNSRLERREVVVDVHVERHTARNVVGRQRPGDLLGLAELFRHRDHEHAEPAAGEEMRRLPMSGLPGSR